MPNESTLSPASSVGSGDNFEEKIQLVEESNRPGMSVSNVARKHGIAPRCPLYCSLHSHRIAEKGTRRHSITILNVYFGSCEKTIQTSF